jgi:nucleoside 2-deoxyribosyltransferase
MLIYLASPYSHPYPSVRNARFDAVCRVAAQLMSRGLLIFSPIAHSHPIACAGDLPTGFDFWERYDRAHMDACGGMIVVMMDGWETSTGVQAEIAYMRAAGKPIAYIAMDMLSRLDEVFSLVHMVLFPASRCDHRCWCCDEHDQCHMTATRTAVPTGGSVPNESIPI